MATILRSSKYISCLNALTRRVIVAHDNANIASKCFTLQVQCINSYLTKSYATSPAIQRIDNLNYEKYLTKLDENVQRYGRVFKYEVEDVLSKVRDTGYIPSLDGLLLIRCCGDLLVDTTPNVRNQLAQEIWTTLETLKIPMDVSHFNALLRVYLENNYEFSPIGILTKMKDSGIEPNRVTYQRLILYYCKKGDIDGATRILEFMREKGLPLNESVFNALIIGHSEANDMESANNILNVMKDAGVNPCSSTYTALLTAYAKRGDINSIKSIINDCGKTELYLHDKEFFEVIHVLAANGHDNKIDEILSLLPKGPNYNLDACHAILKVLDVGNVDAALKILPTMRSRKNGEEESEENMNGTFLIRKLVNAKFPIEKIIKACETLEQQGQHARAFFIALERSLLNGDVDLSMRLLKICKERGETIREHFLWPLFAAQGKVSNYQGIQDLLKFTTSELKIMPGVETIADYILPYTLGKWDDVVTTLKEFRISHETIVNAIALRMLMDNKIRKTAAFMLSYPATYNANNIYRALAEALKATDDARHFVVIVRMLHESAVNQLSKNISKEETAEESNDIGNKNVIDHAMHKALVVLSTRKHAVVNKILDRLIEGGMSLSADVGQHLREYFEDNITPETIEKIDKLTSGTLEMLPVSEFITSGSNDDTDNIAGHSQVLNNQFASKRQQLATCIAANNAKGVQEVIEQLEKQNFTFSPAVYAQIIGIFCGAGNLELTERWFKKCKAEHSEIFLDLHKSTAYAALLIKNDRFDDAIQFILDSPRKELPEDQRPGLKIHIKTLLEVAAETGNVEKTRQLLDALLSAKYTLIDNYILGPLVRVHLIKDDIAGALDEFQRACENHKCTPLKNELSKKFIEAEDANSLQRLTDLSTQVHGESNSLVDLVMSFIECGRLRQARKILETPGLRLRSAKFRYTVKRYIDEGKLEFLDQFLEMTKDLPVLDRQEIYDILMDTYNAKNDWQRGLNLWTEIQEDGAQPSADFLNTLAELLEKNNKPVPFTRQNEQPRPIPVESSYVIDFNKAIENGDLTRAERIIHNAPEYHPDFSTVVSRLIEEVLKQNNVDKAIELTEMLVVKHSRLPRAGAFKLLWNTLVETEKFIELRKLGDQLSATTKKKFRFQKFLNRAALKEVGLRQFMADFKAQITESRSDNFALVKNHIHFSTLLNEFKKDPDAISEFLPLAEKLSAQQIYLPINLAWCYYFEQNRPEALEIWSKHLADSKLIVFRYILNSCMANNNVETAERLHNLLTENKMVSDNAKATVLTALVDLYNKNERYEDAKKVLQNTQPNIVDIVTTINKNSMLQLKKGLEANGKSLPSNLDKRRS